MDDRTHGWPPAVAAASAHRRVIPAAPRTAMARITLLVLAALAAACGRATPPRTRVYTPRARDLVVTTVPLLVKEERSLYPFLAPAFARAGVLDGKEVYAFSPSTLTVVEGDTIHFTFINPEDDDHSFVLPDLAVPLPGGTTTHATYVAKRAGVFPFFCSVASHLPMMTGQLVVLAPSAVGGDSGAMASGSERAP